MDTFFRLGWSGTHNTIHACEITEMLKTTPQRFGPWLVTTAAAHKAAQLREPAVQPRPAWSGSSGGARTVMDGARIERLPFLDLATGRCTASQAPPRANMVAYEHPPGNDAVEGRAALQALRGGQLPGFDPTATFHECYARLQGPSIPQELRK